LSAPPMPIARALGISPRSYACSGDVDIGSARATCPRDTMANTAERIARVEQRTAATLSATARLRRLFRHRSSSPHGGGEAQKRGSTHDGRGKDAASLTLDRRIQPKKPTANSCASFIRPDSKGLTPTSLTRHRSEASKPGYRGWSTRKKTLCFRIAT
jgi:hypothetical protein